MRRLLAIGLISLIGIASPAFAQTQTPANQDAPQGAQAPDGQPQGSPDGLDAFNQVPPPAFSAPLLIGGGLLVGGAILIGVAVSNNDDSPASP